MQQHRGSKASDWFNMQSTWHTDFEHSSLSIKFISQIWEIWRLSIDLHEEICTRAKWWFEWWNEWVFECHGNKSIFFVFPAFYLVLLPSLPLVSSLLHSSWCDEWENTLHGGNANTQWTDKPAKTLTPSRYVNNISVRSTEEVKVNRYAQPHALTVRE